MTGACHLIAIHDQVHRPMRDLFTVFHRRLEAQVISIQHRVLDRGVVFGVSADDSGDLRAFLLQLHVGLGMNDRNSFHAGASVGDFPCPDTCDRAPGCVRRRREREAINRKPARLIGSRSRIAATTTYCSDAPLFPWHPFYHNQLYDADSPRPVLPVYKSR